MTEAETLPVSPSATETNAKLTNDDFVEAAGLQRSEHSRKKSSVEKLLEKSLNTAEASDSGDISPKSPSSPRLMNGNEQITTPVKVKTTPERPQNLKSDEFIEDAGLSRTGNVPRKSSMEKLLEDQLQTGDDAPTTNGYDKSPSSTSPHNRYPMQRSSTIAVTSPTTPTDSADNYNNRRRFSSSASIDSNDGAKPRSRSGRKGSIYEQKQVEVPTAVVGNRIASRTQHLFKQYEKDMASHETKPLPNVNDTVDSSKNYERSASLQDDKTKVDIAREEKAKELEEIRRAYQERLLMEEQEQDQQRQQRIQNQKLKCTHQLGAVKGRYLEVANADPAQKENEAESGGEEENNVLVDKNGAKIEKSGGKERVVSSADGVKNIKALFGNKQQSTWQKPSSNSAESEIPAVDSASVNSARNMFKNFDQQKNGDGSGQKSFNRPTTKKRDAKELMEMRKKATYGDDDEDIQDGVVKKSVVIDESEIASSNKKEALNKYKELESSNKNANGDQSKNRPTNRLLSDNDVKDEFSRRSSNSVSSSEQGDVGYEGSVSPCSPTSEMSDDYISDETPRDEKVLNDSAFEEGRNDEVEVSGGDEN